MQREHDQREHRPVGRGAYGVRRHERHEPLCRSLYRRCTRVTSLAWTTRWRADLRPPTVD